MVLRLAAFDPRRCQALPSDELSDLRYPAGHSTLENLFLSPPPANPDQIRLDLWISTTECRRACRLPCRP